MQNCPICSTATERKRDGTPYWICAGCGLWFQDPLPPKLYHGPEEPPYDDRDKRANEALAKYLFDDVMRCKAGPTLDVGARYPYLAHCLAQKGCEAHAIDGAPDEHSGLDVTIEVADFEQWEPLQASDDCAYRLITFVHVLEHVYDPLAAIRKLRQIIANHGRVFIRMPDHTIKGIERDLTPHHYLIHPYIHCLTSILELLARAKDAFAIESYWAMEPGQMNIVLRPITKRPTIGLGMIVKNEERDLPRLLKSVESVVDGGCIIDTGSSDKTPAIAMHADLGVVLYTDASELVDGDWQLVNFAKARNEFVDRVKAAGYDWLIWMDADDELLTPLAVNRARYMPPSALGMWIELGGGVRQVHYRMWPTSAPVRFSGWCHEFPILGNLPAPVLNDVSIRHDATPGDGETSNARNLRILEAQYKAEPDARCAFYLANTHKDGGRWAEAAKWYQVRIGYGDAFRDEYLFALLYLARCYRSARLADDAYAECIVGLARAPDWQEFRMECAFIAYERKDYTAAIEHAQKAFDKPIPPTVLWREKQMYGDQPARMISWCYQHQGRITDALVWSEIAMNRIGGPDKDWQARHETLRVMRDAPKAPAIIKGIRRKVALVRPGAIGDILMTLNLLPAFLEANPETDVHYFCAAQYAREDALGWIIKQAGAVPMDAAGLDANREDYDRIINLVGYPLAEGYPFKPMRQHLLRYFAGEMGLMIDGLPQLVLRTPERFDGLPGEYATLHVVAGWSPYKNWPLDRWQEVIAALPFQVIQIGGEREPRVAGTVGRFYGTLANSIGVFANAKMHIGVDSWPNHASNYFWGSGDTTRCVRALILWGSTQPSAAGYSANVNLCANLDCSPCFRESAEISRERTEPCPHLIGGRHPCMDAITAEQVIESAKGIWK